MILADTNVIVALLVADRSTQKEAALTFFERALGEGSTVTVGESVLTEACWVLERSYGIQRASVANALGQLLDTPPLRAWDPEIAAPALELTARDPRLSMVDSILAVRGARDGAEVLTFDRALQKSMGG